ncbi:hypothetical protein HK100_008310 [Physocladia obscura]|uniref:VWFA domain-containing protein n=1 Tax=Physocladia obscura TaxID=109957 RepID=A0AAD5SPA4_9FUNG|nr:hypothetical protein HK100_008310 [Physocladia obscura]
MMIRFGNLRGEGVCANNLGNVYRMFEGEFQKALEKYQRAISIANTLLQSNETVESRAILKNVLAVRLNNLGVLWKDHATNSSGSDRTTHAAMAESLFNKSLDLHRETDNMEGIAQVSGNLGQLYLVLDRNSEAEELITDAFTVVRDRNNDPIALQYACMNMGLLCEKNKKFAEAATWYMYVLQRFKVVVKFVQRICVTNLIALCMETDPKRGVNRPELGRVLKEKAEPIFGGIAKDGLFLGKKNIMFVLDCSGVSYFSSHIAPSNAGSMSGGYIRTCRDSICKIIEENCSDSDSISMIKFNSQFQVLFSNHSKSKPNQKSDMLNKVRTETDANGGTAFYDAIAHALRLMTSPAETSGQNWIISLTDGEDGSWKKAESIQFIKNTLTLHRDFGVIVITVGRLRNEAEIRNSIINVAGNGKGLLIRSESNLSGIQGAFGKAVRMMQGDVTMQEF